MINDYEQYSQWLLDRIYFATRQKNNVLYTSIDEFKIKDEFDPGILKDKKKEISKNDKTIELRRIAYWYEPLQKVYEFILITLD
ncbi:MAG: hypothetical protein GXO85_01610 [Chlorobi bacterium]|nr:hypothetical protein [Chlorobiota bacterium]